MEGDGGGKGVAGVYEAEVVVVVVLIEVRLRASDGASPVKDSVMAVVPSSQFPVPVPVPSSCQGQA